MATLTAQPMNRGGLGPTYASVTIGGDACPCGYGVFLHFKNTAGSGRQVQLNIPAGRVWEPGVVPAPVLFTVPATTGDRMVGPVDALTFADPITGLCSITYPAGADAALTVAVVQLVQ